MNLTIVNELIEKQDGDFSMFYPKLKHRLHIYKDEEKYLTIKKHMLKNDIRQEVVDIGCQHGFQSEIFLDAISYTGIDCSVSSHFFNQEKENIHYILGTFPDVDIDLKGKTVISSMSLGIFDGFVDDDKEVSRKRVIDALSSAKTVYIASEEDFVEQLSKRFSSKEMLLESNLKNYNLYVLRN